MRQLTRSPCVKNLSLSTLERKNKDPFRHKRLPPSRQIHKVEIALKSPLFNSFCHFHQSSPPLHPPRRFLPLPERAQYREPARVIENVIFRVALKEIKVFCKGAIYIWTAVVQDVSARRPIVPQWRRNCFQEGWSAVIPFGPFFFFFFLMFNLQRSRFIVQSIKPEYLVAVDDKGGLQSKKDLGCVIKQFLNMNLTFHTSTTDGPFPPRLFGC